jgi:hypothetical protein
MVSGTSPASSAAVVARGEALATSTASPCRAKRPASAITLISAWLPATALCSTRTDVSGGAAATTDAGATPGVLYGSPRGAGAVGAAGPLQPIASASAAPASRRGEKAAPRQRRPAAGSSHRVTRISVE